MLERKIYLVSALFFIGMIVLVISIVTGFLLGTFFGFSISLLSGIVSCMIFFALAHILNNQQSILFKLQQLEEIYNKQMKQENKQCSNCNYEYGVTLNSCPNCGARD